MQTVLDDAPPLAYPVVIHPDVISKLWGNQRPINILKHMPPEPERYEFDYPMDDDDEGPGNDIGKKDALVHRLLPNTFKNDALVPQIRAMTKQGRGRFEIARLLKITPERLAGTLEANNLDKPADKPFRTYRSSRYLSVAQRQFAVNFWSMPADIISVDDIAKELNRTRKQTLAFMRRLGFPHGRRGSLRQALLDQRLQLFSGKLVESIDNRPARGDSDEEVIWAFLDDPDEAVVEPKTGSTLDLDALSPSALADVDDPASKPGIEESAAWERAERLGYGAPVPAEALERVRGAASPVKAVRSREAVEQMLGTTLYNMGRDRKRTCIENFLAALYRIAAKDWKNYKHYSEPPKPLTGKQRWTADVRNEFLIRMISGQHREGMARAFNCSVDAVKSEMRWSGIHRKHLPGFCSPRRKTMLRREETMLFRIDAFMQSAFWKFYDLCWCPERNYLYARLKKERCVTRMSPLEAARPRDDHVLI